MYFPLVPASYSGHFFFVVAVLPIIALINLLPNKTIENVTKLVWVIVIVFVPVIGSILFFLIGPVRKMEGIRQPST